MDEVALEERIADIKAMKRFGEQLGLDYGKAFTRVDLKRPPEFYWLYVCHKDRMECPEVTGRVSGRPFLTFDDKDSALEREKQLRTEGFDTFLFSSEAAGSTDCPITSSLLDARRSRRAETLLHEGFHTTKNLRHMRQCRNSEKGPRSWLIPYQLEEAIAAHVGLQGAILYGREHAPGLIAEAEARHTWWSEYADLINRYLGQLESCLSSGSDVEAVWQAIRDEDPDGRFVKHHQLNNAYFLRNIDYTRDTPLVRKALEGVNLRDYLADPTDIHRTFCEAIGEPFYG